ncbi:MAG: cell division protein FtsZ [Patescibacteria group bacterium]
MSKAKKKSSLMRLTSKKLSASRANKRVKKISPQKRPVLAEVSPEEIKLKRTKIRVVGIGEGGSSIVSGISSHMKRATFWAANTNKQALRELGRNVVRFQFGENFTRGLGTGMNPGTGEMAALAEKDKIKKIFEGQDLCVIVACLGGGSGSGAAPIFAKIAKSAGCLTYGIFTLPFNFEGEKKAAIAKEALERLKLRLHAFSVIPNERIFQIIDKETPLKKALSAINERLAQSLEGLIEIIYEPGLINIDFADLRTVLEGRGRLTYLNCADVRKKEGAIQEEIEKLLNSPLYPYGIRGAKGVLYNIAGGKDLALSEISQVSKTISGLVNKEAKIIFGISQNQKYEGLIKTTLLATGCGTKIFTNDKPIKIESKDLPGKKPEQKKPVVKKTVKKKPEKAKGVIVKKSAVKFKKARVAKKKILKRVKVKTRKKIKIKVLKPLPVAEGAEDKIEARVRKNALQLKKEADEVEAGMLAREKAWETPAFLRRRKIL